MLEIPNIDPEKVARWGDPFLKLAQEAHRSYEQMMRREEDRPEDPNHQNIIELSSDDQFGDDDELDDLAGDEESTGERSHFFQQAPEVNAFNARRELITSVLPKSPFDNL